MHIHIHDRKIGIGEPPYIIAELSANHNGSLERALDLVTAAKKNGADAVKIQSYTADTMTLDCDGDGFFIKDGMWSGYTLYDLYKEAHTPFEWHKPIFEHAKKVGITVFSSPFDESAVDLLDGLGAPAYKIASFEAVDLPLIRYVAKKGKPIIISTGTCSESEVDEAVDAARTAGCNDIVLLHCVSCYPAPSNSTNLLQMPMLGQKYNVPFGLSDHTLGTATSVAAVALGACIIEKHFTFDRLEPGPDSAFSLEPAELSKLTTDAYDAWVSLGQPGFIKSAEELDNRRFRRSLYFVKPLTAGEVITTDNIRRIRPGYGLAPKYLEMVLGKCVKVNVARGEPVRWNVIEGL